jgi:GT2 family glycosyltransferase
MSGPITPWAEGGKVFSVSVVIPTFNGHDLLRQNLPPLFECLSHISAAWEVIVVDDASTDNSIELMQQTYPQVMLIRNETNLGFAETMNRGIHAARYDVLFALNNDVTVDADALKTMLARFDDPAVFAVTPNVLDPKSGRQQAIYKLKPGICWFNDTSLTAPPAADEIALFFSSGGSSCYDRRKLVELGGFSNLYAPFYVEDVDLSYHAWKRGWKCVMEPAATVWHPVNSTIRKYHRQRRIKFLIARNKHIFLWVNITDPVLVVNYFLWLLPSLLWDILAFRKYKLVGMFMALQRIAAVTRERSRRRLTFTRTDRAIISMVR